MVDDLNGRIVKETVALVDRHEHTITQMSQVGGFPLGVLGTHLAPTFQHRCDVVFFCPAGYLKDTNMYPFPVYPDSLTLTTVVATS